MNNRLISSTDNPLPAAGRISEEQLKTEYEKSPKEKYYGRVERINRNQGTS